MHWQAEFGGREWRIAPNGVYSRDSSTRSSVGAYHCTLGEPRTINRYLDAWSHHIVVAGRNTDVPMALILMTLCTENGAAHYDGSDKIKVPVFREEPGYLSDDETPHRISFGPCHILLSSARTAMGQPDLDRTWLMDVGNNIAAAARFIANQRSITKMDPVRVAAAYNSGGIKQALPGSSRYGNRWHLKSYGNHIDRAVNWYGDACRVLVSGS